MRVILTQSISKIGSAGDIVNVKDGYAVNNLIPKGLAKEATEQEISKLERKEIDKRVDSSLDLQRLKSYLEKQEIPNNITYNVLLNDNGSLFENISDDKISNKIYKEAKTSKRPKIIINKNIDSIGKFPIKIEYNGVIMDLYINVLEKGKEKNL